MNNRTLLLLQSIIAICAWLLVILGTWRWFFDLRETLGSGDASEIPGSTLVSAGLVVLLSIILLALAIERVHKFLRAPKDSHDH